MDDQLSLLQDEDEVDDLEVDSEPVPTEGLRPLTAESIEKIEKQIDACRQVVKYNIREYPVEVIIDKYTSGLPEDENELFIPDYQRHLTWGPKRKSKFIESVFIGLPIPYLFSCDVAPLDWHRDDGRFEIVDGSQRVRTLAEFVDDKFALQDLKTLTTLNGLRFSQLPLSRRRRFKRTTLRLIELEKGTTELTRRDLFERINTGSKQLTDMDIRWGIMDGDFVRFIAECAEDTTFRALTPFSDEAVALREPQEFVLRFFAYYENRDAFRRSVKEFLDDYLKSREAELQSMPPEEKSARLEGLRNVFARTMEFVQANIPGGFRKGPTHSRTPRIRFEAIAVGTALALQECPNLANPSVDWVDSEAFKALARSDASNSRPKLFNRIDFVTNHLLGRQ